MASPGRWFESPAAGALTLRSIPAIQIGSSVDMAPPRLRELIALSLLAGLGFGHRSGRRDFRRCFWRRLRNGD
jgi:hypothetical protein